MANTNCFICGSEVDTEESKKILKFYVCLECLDKTDPEKDFAEVKTVLKNFSSFNINKTK